MNWMESSMIAIAKSLMLSSTPHLGLSLVTMFGLVGLVASFVLMQHGVDLSSATIG